jgi:hypothetical protein
MRSAYREKKASEQRAAWVYRYSVEKFGQEEVLAALDPKVRADMSRITEGDPQTRAMGRVVRCFEALKQALQRPGSPDDDAVELAEARLAEARKILEGFRPEEDEDEDDQDDA